MSSFERTRCPDNRSLTKLLPVREPVVQPFVTKCTILCRPEITCFALAPRNRNQLVSMDGIQKNGTGRLTATGSKLQVPERLRYMKVLKESNCPHEFCPSDRTQAEKATQTDRRNPGGQGLSQARQNIAAQVNNAAQVKTSELNVWPMKQTCLLPPTLGKNQGKLSPVGRVSSPVNSLRKQVFNGLSGVSSAAELCPDDYRSNLRGSGDLQSPDTHKSLYSSLYKSLLLNPAPSPSISQDKTGHAHDKKAKKKKKKLRKGKRKKTRSGRKTAEAGDQSSVPFIFSKKIDHDVKQMLLNVMTTRCLSHTSTASRELKSDTSRGRRKSASSLEDSTTRRNLTALCGWVVRSHSGPKPVAPSPPKEPKAPKYGGLRKLRVRGRAVRLPEGEEPTTSDSIEPRGQS